MEGPKQNDFQSELAKAIQRRSQEKEQVAAADNRRSSSSDVDALPKSKSTEALVGSVKDRITFLEKKGFVPAGGGGGKSVRISGITTDQSSTDLDDTGSRGAATMRGALGKSESYHSAVGGLIAQEVEEGQANRLSAYRSATTNGFLRDHDAASLNSQSSASTLSSGYESPTLKYGMGGEQLWSQTPQIDTSRCVKFAQGNLYLITDDKISPKDDFGLLFDSGGFELFEHSGTARNESTAHSRPCLIRVP